MLVAPDLGGDLVSDTPPVPPTPPEPTPAYTPAPTGYTPPPAAAPGYTPPPGYAQPGYAQPYNGYATAPRTNVLAIVSLCLSLGALVFGITAIGGIITGHIALGQIKRTGEGGHGIALAGTIIGWVLSGIGVLLIVGYIVFVVILFGAAATSGSFSSSYDS
jgi:hypothetical protein